MMRQRVAAASVARLATTDAAGKPHLVPCCYALEGETVYSPVDDVKAKSTRALRRLENIRIRPEVTLLVDHYEDDWSALWWVRLDGAARIFDDTSPEHGTGTRLLRAKYEQYADASLRGPVIAISITRWSAWP